MRAHLTIQTSDPQGRLVTQRKAHNAVMLQGAELIAKLFAGNGSPISHMGVGNREELTGPEFEINELLNDPDSDGLSLTGELVAPLPQDSVRIEPDPDNLRIRVTIRGVMPEAAAVGTIREAGLLADTPDGMVLYNRVEFEPIEKADDHELTLFWQIDFPFGDVQWVL